MKELRYDISEMKPVEFTIKQYNENSFVFYKQQCISEEICKQTIEYMEDSGQLQPSLTAGIVDSVSRPNAYSMLGGQPVAPLYNTMCDFAHEVLDTTQILPKFITNGIKLHKYDTNGYFNWHADDGISSHNTPRQFTMLAYLNNDFEGGFTEFLFQQLTIKPKSGLVILYPSNMSHIHRGTPVLSNAKYLATIWISEASRALFF